MKSWTVGPQATPPGAASRHAVRCWKAARQLRRHDALDPLTDGDFHLGEVELLTVPALQPAEPAGCGDIDDRFGPGKVKPLVDVTGRSPLGSTR
jgi:hypothetical protein